MKAIKLSAVGAPLEVCEVPTPKPADDQVLVRVAGCGVCHTDIGFWMDGVPTKHGLPITLGHEVSGVVVDAGSEHRHLVGREVIVPAVIPCGTCELCLAGRGNICRQQLMPGNDMEGGFAEYLAAPGRGLCVVERRGGYELAELAVIADAVTTPYQAIVRSGLDSSDVAIVVGVGGVGTYCAQIAAACGAHVVAIDVDDTRLAIIGEHGAARTFNSAQTDLKTLKKAIIAQARDWGCRSHSWKIFECSGHAAGQQTAYGLLTYAATLMLVGFTMDKIEIRLSNAMAFDATIQGTWGCRPELYPEALRLVIDKEITLKPFIERHPMSQGPAVLQSVAEHMIERRAILEPDWSVS